MSDEPDYWENGVGGMTHHLKGKDDNPEQLQVILVTSTLYTCRVYYTWNECLGNDTPRLKACTLRVSTGWDGMGSDIDGKFNQVHVRPKTERSGLKIGC